MPEDKKLAFSNSNVRSIVTHPIETTLMSDLKKILEETRAQKTVKVEDIFWHTALLATSSILVLAVAVFTGLLFQSVSLPITIALCLGVTAASITEASEQRRKYTKHVPMETVIIEVSLILSTPIIPVLLWWILSPSTGIAVLLTILIIAGYGYLSDLIEKLTKQNPVGALSPSQVGNYYDVFISYSRKNTAEADEICELLEREGLTYFIDRQAIPGGSEFPTVLADGIRNCGIFLCLLSEESASSKFCQLELQYAENNKSKEDIFLLFLNKDFRDLLYKAIDSQNNLKKIFQELTQLSREDNWQRIFVNLIVKKLHKSKEYQNHQTLLNGHSMIGLIKAIVSREAGLKMDTTKSETMDFIKNNPISIVVTTATVLSAVFSYFFQSWIIVLGIYSFLVPLPLYLLTHSLIKSLIESLQIVAFCTWVGLLSSSVWTGIIAFISILIIVSVIDNNKDSKFEEEER